MSCLSCFLLPYAPPPPKVSNSLLCVRDAMLALRLDNADPQPDVDDQGLCQGPPGKRAGGDTGGYPGLFRALSIIWLMQYLGARMLPMPVMVYVFYQSDWSSMPVNDTCIIQCTTEYSYFLIFKILQVGAMPLDAP